MRKAGLLHNPLGLSEERGGGNVGKNNSQYYYAYLTGKGNCMDGFNPCSAITFLRG
jgi:hypothetical protein